LYGTRLFIYVEEIGVPESIEIKLQRAVITLAEELSYSRAAGRLNTAPAELRKQISGLEKQLCFHIFRSKQINVELTEEGKVFLRACLEFRAQRNHSQ